MASSEFGTQLISPPQDPYSNSNRLNVKNTTDSITFNTAGLTLSAFSLTTPTHTQPRSLSIETVQLDPANERATIPLPFPLEQGSVVELKIGFSSPLTDVLKGYYRSAWEADGKTDYYAVTQFEVWMKFLVDGVDDYITDPCLHHILNSAHGCSICLSLLGRARL